MGVKDVIELIDDLLDSSPLPKNAKKALEEAKASLQGNEEISVRIIKAVYSIEKVMEDPNLMPHVRMELWEVMSALEGLKAEE